MSNNKLENVIRYMLKAKKADLQINSEKNDSICGIENKMNGIDRISKYSKLICNLCVKGCSVKDVSTEMNL